MTANQSANFNNSCTHAQILSALGLTGKVGNKKKHHSIKYHFSPTSFEELAKRASKKLGWSSDEIESLLKSIDADNRETWIKVGMALHFEFEGNSEGLKIWHSYSKKSHKYEPEKLDESWETFGKDPSREPMGLATMIGWKNTGLHIDKNYALDGAGKEFRSSGSISIDCIELRKKLGPISWLVEGFIEKDTVGLFFGDPASYKSFLAMDIAYHCASGKDWHGSKVIQGPVYYIAGEGHGGLARRQEAWFETHNPDLSNLPFRFTIKAMNFHKEEEVQQVNQDIQGWVETVGNPVLIVIDTLARNFNADENSAEHMGQFINNVNEHLRVPFGCVVLIVHHTGHHDKKRARGSTSLKAGIDFEYLVNKVAPLVAKLTCTKMKDAVEPDVTGFQGRKVMLNWPAEGEELIDSLVFERTDIVEQERRNRPILSHHASLLELASELKNSEGVVNRAELGERAVSAGLARDKDQVRGWINTLKRRDLLEVIDRRHIRLLNNP